MNHQALIERSHKQAVDKGFWETPLTESMSLALMNSELYEALEAIRKSRVNPDWSSIEAIKESKECEIADTTIRAYDHAGGHKLQIAILNNVNFVFTEDEGANILLLNAAVNHVGKSENKEVALSSLLTGLYQYATFSKFDLLKYIMWKLDYNLTRAYKHGKQF